MDRVTVSEAARILGIKEESVRKRVSRGKLRADKDEDGRLLVYLDRTQTVRDEYTDESVTDRDELLASKDRIISILENQLPEEREARRRADTIIAQLARANEEQARTIRELEAPSEASASSETVEEEPERAEPQSVTEGAQESTELPQQRSGSLAPVDKIPWWQYLLGLGMIAGISAVLTLGGTYTLIHAVFGHSVAVDLVAILLLWMIPGIFGFWIGFKRRNFRLWRHLVPIGALVGVSAAGAAAPQTAAELGLGELPFVTVLIFIPALLLFISGATIGRAVQRRTAGAYASLLPDTEATPSAPRLSAPGDKLSPRMQALLGFSGAVISALISVIGQIIVAGMGGGG